MGFLTEDLDLRGGRWLNLFLIMTWESLRLLGNEGDAHKSINGTGLFEDSVTPELLMA